MELKIALDNALRDALKLYYREIDIVIDRIFYRLTTRNCEKVNWGVKSAKVKRQTRSCVIKHGVRPRKIGCSRPASTLQRRVSGRVRGRPSSHSPNRGREGRSKGPVLLFDLNGHNNHVLPADGITPSLSRKFRKGSNKSYPYP